MCKYIFRDWFVELKLKSVADVDFWEKQYLLVNITANILENITGWLSQHSWTIGVI